MFLIIDCLIYSQNLRIRHFQTGLQALFQLTCFFERNYHHVGIKFDSSNFEVFILFYGIRSNSNAIEDENRNAITKYIAKKQRFL